MRAVVLGYGGMGCAGLEALLESGYSVQALFTHTDDPAESQWYPSVAELAARKDIPVFAPDDINTPLWINRIRQLDPQILFSFYYRKMLCPEIL
ncbi:MAG: bifunctional UDP-glucuronic acid oxidase/UDP-4-amino-4-deoxy-L-arabinose formyltransferase, partial [Gammaproteobacteria bacterium]